MLKLFSSVGSCALASLIVLEEAGAPYEAIRISLKDGDQLKPDYLALNPKGRVPALVTERGVITENVAILAYVAQTFPQALLAPVDDPFAFAQAQAFNSYLASTVHVAYAHWKRGYRWADDPAALAHLAELAPARFTRTFQVIEGGMLQGPYVLGARFSICDAYLFVFEDWLVKWGCDIAAFPKVAAHYALVGERPAVKKALVIEAA